MILKFVFLVAVYSVITSGCCNAEQNDKKVVSRHPLVGKWELVKGRRPPGQSQFQADQYFRTIELLADGSLRLTRDKGTETGGTWVYDEGAEALILNYKGGHDPAGFPAQRPLQVFSHIKLEGDILIFPNLASQEMTYRRAN